MKNCVLFAFLRDEPSGGAADFVLSGSLDECMVCAEEACRGGVADMFQIADAATMRVMLRGERKAVYVPVLVDEEAGYALVWEQ